MALSPEAAARVYVVGKDPIVTRTLSRLLELDERIDVLGEAPTVVTAPVADLHPDVLILDENGRPDEARHAGAYVDRVTPGTRIVLLETLRNLTVSDLLETVKQMAPSPEMIPERHLHAVDAPAQTGRDALANLSERELEVVRLVAEGLSNKEISGRLSLSDKTVKNHISHILAKMNLTARTQVAVYAIRAGLV